MPQSNIIATVIDCQAIPEGGVTQSTIASAKDDLFDEQKDQDIGVFQNEEFVWRVRYENKNDTKNPTRENQRRCCAVQRKKRRDGYFLHSDLVKLVDQSTKVCLIAPRQCAPNLSLCYTS